MPLDTAQFGQADLSKTEAHTEAPMTQLGRAAASSSIIDHVCLFRFLFPVSTDTKWNCTAKNAIRVLEISFCLLLFGSFGYILRLSFRCEENPIYIW